MICSIPSGILLGFRLFSPPPPQFRVWLTPPLKCDFARLPTSFQLFRPDFFFFLNEIRHICDYSGWIFPSRFGHCLEFRNLDLGRFRPDFVVEMMSLALWFRKWSWILLNSVLIPITEKSEPFLQFLTDTSNSGWNRCAFPSNWPRLVGFQSVRMDWLNSGQKVRTSGDDSLQFRAEQLNIAEGFDDRNICLHSVRPSILHTKKKKQKKSNQISSTNWNGW